MESSTAIDALSALAQPTRLAVFRMLVNAGPVGMAAGDIAARLDVRQNTMSANLAILQTARLLRSAREGRSIRYFADMEHMGRLLAFLLEDCCGGQPDLCQPAIANLSCAC